MAIQCRQGYSQITAFVTTGRWVSEKHVWLVEVEKNKMPDGEGAQKHSRAHSPRVDTTHNVKTTKLSNKPAHPQ